MMRRVSLRCHGWAGVYGADFRSRLHYFADAIEAMSIYFISSLGHGHFAEGLDDDFISRCLGARLRRPTIRRIADDFAAPHRTIGITHGMPIRLKAVYARIWPQ